MPYPPPAIFQFILCLDVAPSSLGYQVRGTVIVRPSFRDTLRAESVNETSATLSSAPSAKIPMPSLQKLLLVLHYDAIKTPNSRALKPKFWARATGSSQMRDRLDPRARVVVRSARDCRNRIDTVRNGVRLACERILTSGALPVLLKRRKSALGYAHAYGCGLRASTSGRLQSCASGCGFLCQEFSAIKRGGTAWAINWPFMSDSMPACSLRLSSTTQVQS